MLYNHRTRIKTEANAKVVTSVWGEEFFKFLAALAILSFAQDDPFLSNHIGAIHPIIENRPRQNS